MPIDIIALEKAIKRAIVVTHLEIKDQSSGCGDSYAIVLVAEIFQGEKSLKRHRLVNGLLKDQIAQMHAFSVETYTPAEYEERQAKMEYEESQAKMEGIVHDPTARCPVPVAH